MGNILLNNSYSHGGKTTQIILNSQFMLCRDCDRDWHDLRSDLYIYKYLAYQR